MLLQWMGSGGFFKHRIVVHVLETHGVAYKAPRPPYHEVLLACFYLTPSLSATNRYGNSSLADIIY